MTGKGDKPRPYNKSKFDQNFDRIFNKPKGEKKNGNQTATNQRRKTTTKGKVLVDKEKTSKLTRDEQKEMNSIEKIIHQIAFGREY